MNNTSHMIKKMIFQHTKRSIHSRHSNRAKIEPSCIFHKSELLSKVVKQSEIYSKVMSKFVYFLFFFCHLLINRLVKKMFMDMPPAIYSKLLSLLVVKLLIVCI